MSDVQRVRMMAAALEIVGELGYGGMTVARVTARAGVSRRTFYDIFSDREDCFLAVFEESVSRAAVVARQAMAKQQTWHERVRAGLLGLLCFCDEEPTMGALLVVEALSAGPRVLEHRARVLERLIAVIEGGRAEGGVPPAAAAAALTAEGIVGAVLAIVHARMLERERRPFVGLLNPLMGMIVLPYLGPAAAVRELERATPLAPLKPLARASSPLEDLDMRLTYRTLRVLAAIATHPQASNRLVGDTAGVQDQGQISKLLARLETLGLVVNTGRGQPKGEPNAWVLTPKGQQVERSIKTQA